MSNLQTTPEHANWLKEIKERISRAQNEILPQAGAQTIPAIVPRIAGQLPWSHIKIIPDKIKDHQEALFYIHETIWGSA